MLLYLYFCIYFKICAHFGNKTIYSFQDRDVFLSYLKRCLPGLPCLPGSCYFLVCTVNQLFSPKANTCTEVPFIANLRKGYSHVLLLLSFGHYRYLVIPANHL